MKADFSNVAFGQTTGNEIRLDLRFSWGGASQQTWQGNVQVSGGRIEAIRPLGLYKNSATDIRLEGSQPHRAIRVRQSRATAFNGFDCRLIADENAELSIEFKSTEENVSIMRYQVAVRDLINQAWRETLDTKNQIYIQRVPGDRLQVDFDRDSLVFSPGERAVVRVRPHHPGLDPGASAICRLTLRASADSQKYWQTEHGVTSDKNGNVEPLSDITLPIPESEGVYQIDVELSSGRFGRFVPIGKTICRRSVQFVVIAPRTPTRDVGGMWREQHVLDPAKEDSWRTRPITQLVGFQKGRLGNQKSTTIQVGDQAMVRMAPGGWQALPIPVEQIGKPHLVDIEYYGNHPMSLGMSIMEADATGAVPMFGVDTGISIPDRAAATHSNKVQHHQFVFWPSTTNPYLLIANQNDEKSATIGRVRLYAGPSRLVADQRRSNSEASRRRQFLLMHESALFARSFGALPKMDQTLNQPLDDWQTFYQGADRMIQYLKTYGYTGMMLTVADGNDTIYPSRFLRSTPKFDSGRFSSHGYDPIQKDVLEMLFRMFDREGLTLVPVVHFSELLPELETLGNAERDPIDLVDRSGRSMRVGYLQGATHRPPYNPLNPSVQQAMLHVVDELLERYRNHASFGGLGIGTGPDSFVGLPGDRWGYERETIKQFFVDQKLGDAREVEQRTLPELEAMLSKQFSSQWLKWRAVSFSRLMIRLGKRVTAGTSNTKLFLTTADLYRSQSAQTMLTPSLKWRADFEQAMIQHGFLAELLASEPSILFLNPHRIAPTHSLADNRVELQVENSDASSDFFHAFPTTGQLFAHRASWAHFEQFERAKPFGDSNSPMMRRQLLTPSGFWNRERFVDSLGRSDSTLFVDGGPTIPMGQQPAIASLIEVFTSLPDVPFSEVSSSTQRERTPVLVRQRQVGDDWYFYAANKTPWPIRVEIRLTGVRGGLNSLSQRALELVPSADEGTSTLAIELQPYELIGGTTAGSRASIGDFTCRYPPGVVDELRQQIHGLKQVVKRAASVPPVGVLVNSGFEGVDEPWGQTDWKFDQRHQANVQRVAADPYQGKRALRLTSDGEVVWIRSNTFTPSETGRLSVSVWLRTDAIENQPPLRLAIEGKYGGEDFYRFGTVGSLSRAERNQLGTQWKRFAVHFDGLPVDGLSDVRIGFDLMGRGRVWIDQVQVFDRWFDHDEAKVLMQLLSLAGYQLDQGDVNGCRKVLEGYWPRFLKQHLGDPSALPPQEREANQQAESRK